MILNKNIKQWLNFGLCIGLSSILLWTIWNDIKKQNIDWSHWGTDFQLSYLIFASLLLPLNLFLEHTKWRLLIQQKSIGFAFSKTLKSIFVGIAVSIITPNKIGEYPARMFFLTKHPMRLIPAVIIGIASQLATVSFLGTLGLAICYSMLPNYLNIILISYTLVMICCIVLFLILVKRKKAQIIRFSLFKKIYAIQRIIKGNGWHKIHIPLFISTIRFFIYSLQFWLLLQWQNIDLNLWEGLPRSFVYFFAVTAIPSFAVADIGIRGKLGLLLLSTASSNAAGIVTATTVLWLFNIVLPTIIGAIFLVNHRFFSNEKRIENKN